MKKTQPCSYCNRPPPHIERRIAVFGSGLLEAYDITVLQCEKCHAIQIFLEEMGGA